MSSSPRTVVAVSSDALRPELLDMLMADDGYTMIVVESIARSYSRISDVHPGLVVLFIKADDEDACRLLSMLQNDCAMSGVRVLMCETEPVRAAALSRRASEDRSESVAAAAS